MTGRAAAMPTPGPLPHRLSYGRAGGSPVAEQFRVQVRARTGRTRPRQSSLGLRIGLWRCQLTHSVVRPRQAWKKRVMTHGDRAHPAWCCDIASLPTTIGGLPSTPAEGPPWSRRGNRASATEFARETVYDAAMTPAATTNGAVEGTIERVTYHNADNGFAVLQLDVRGHRDPVTVVGACPGGNEVRRRDGSRPPRGPNL